MIFTQPFNDTYIGSANFPEDIPLKPLLAKVLDPGVN
jgi:hypothetical protein